MAKEAQQMQEAVFSRTKMDNMLQSWDEMDIDTGEDAKAAKKAKKVSQGCQK